MLWVLSHNAIKGGNMYLQFNGVSKFLLSIVILLFFLIHNMFSMETFERKTLYRYQEGNKIIAYEIVYLIPKSIYKTCVDNEGNIFKSIDNGNTWYLIHLNSPSTINLDIFPNPVLDRLNFNLDISHRGTVEINIYDIYGNSHDDFIVMDYKNRNVDVSFLYTGMYILSIKLNNGNTITKQFIKL